MVTFIKNHGKLIFFLICLVALAVVINIMYIYRFNHKTKSTKKRHELSSRTRYVCSERHPDVTRFKTTPVIHDFKFFYPINIYHACEKGSVETIMPVLSAVGNFKRREKTRRLSWGQMARVSSTSKVIMLFFVGLPASEYHDENLSFQRTLANESKHFGDIIQVNEKDFYGNIVYKAIAVLHWISKFCPTADFVLKIDDDVFVEVPRLLLSLYKKKYSYKNFIIGDLQVDKEPIRKHYVKWYVPEEEYPNSTYPPFLASPAIGFPTSTASLLYQQALRTKLIRLHDVFLTGICSAKLGIPLLHDKGYAFVHRLMREPNSTFI